MRWSIPELTAAAAALATVGTLAWGLVRPAPPEAALAAPPAALSAQARAGHTLWQSKGCSACHSLDGSGGRPGPTLQGVVARRGAGWVRTFLVDPQAVSTPSGMMPAYPFSAEDAQALVAYLAQPAGAGPGG